MSVTWTQTAIAAKIAEIEATYKAALPIAYQRLLYLAGDALLSNNIPASSPRYSPEISIDELQAKARSLMQCLEADSTPFPQELKQAFFILFHYTEVMAEYYWIRTDSPKDTAVYCWRVFDDENSVEQFSRTIEDWLRQLHFSLYLSTKIRSLFHRKSQLN
jgi:hypothetical protein